MKCGDKDAFLWMSATKKRLNSWLCVWFLTVLNKMTDGALLAWI